MMMIGRFTPSCTLCFVVAEGTRCFVLTRLATRPSLTDGSRCPVSSRLMMGFSVSWQPAHEFPNDPHLMRVRAFTPTKKSKEVDYALLRDKYKGLKKQFAIRFHHEIYRVGIRFACICACILHFRQARVAETCR
jgi:hypothetical protein